MRVGSWEPNAKLGDWWGPSGPGSPGAPARCRPLQRRFSCTGHDHARVLAEALWRQKNSDVPGDSLLVHLYIHQNISKYEKNERRLSGKGVLWKGVLISKTEGGNDSL